MKNQFIILAFVFVVGGVVGGIIVSQVKKCPPDFIDGNPMLTEGRHWLAYVSQEDIDMLRKQNGYGKQMMYDVSKGGLFVQ